MIDLPWFWAYVDAHRRWPGVRHVRAATELATDRARSAGESRLRMIPVLGGLPDPLVNAPVYRAGILIAILDLWLHAGERDVGIEYDGAYHEQSDQHRADNRRENALVGAGSFPLLRYDRFTVTRQAERLRALRQMGLAIGVEPASWLDPLWFGDPRRALVTTSGGLRTSHGLLKGTKVTGSGKRGAGQVAARRSFSAATSNCGAGHCGSRPSRWSISSCCTTHRADHLRSAGTTYQGASAVEQRPSASW